MISNYDKMLFAKELQTKVLQRDALDYVLRDKTLFDCGVTAVNDIDFGDPSIGGLLDILKLDINRIPSMTLQELHHCLWMAIGEDWYFCGKALTEGFAELVEASMVDGGLTSINRLFGILAYPHLKPLQELKKEGVDPNEHLQFGGDVYTMQMWIRSFDTWKDDEDYATDIEEENNIFISTDFNAVFDEGNTSLSSVLKKYIDKMHDSDQFKYGIQSIDISKNGEMCLSISMRGTLPRDNNFVFDLKKAMTTANVDIEEGILKRELSLPSRTGQATQILKGILLENGLGI
jgi:hypothetical protein